MKTDIKSLIYSKFQLPKLFQITERSFSRALILHGLGIFPSIHGSANRAGAYMYAVSILFCDYSTLFALSIQKITYSFQLLTLVKYEEDIYLVTFVSKYTLLFTSNLTNNC